MSVKEFAQLDENNIVTWVTQIEDKECVDSSGDFDPVLGIQFLKSVFGANTNWVYFDKESHISGGQLDISNYGYNIVGGKHHSEINKISQPRYYRCWNLDEDTAIWSAPIPEPIPPKGHVYEWDDDDFESGGQGWILKSLTTS